MHKQYKEDNKEYIRELIKQYRENNNEYMTQWRKQNYENNKEDICQKQKTYRENNKGHITQYANEQITCNICDCQVARANMARHQRTNKCKSSIKPIGMI